MIYVYEIYGQIGIKSTCYDNCYYLDYVYETCSIIFLSIIYFGLTSSLDLFAVYNYPLIAILFTIARTENNWIFNVIAQTCRLKLPSHINIGYVTLVIIMYGGTKPR